MLLGIAQSMHASSLGTLHASRPTAICSDVMAVCSVQIEITESGDRLTTSTATVVEPMLI